jgi:hypothetical protein
MSFMVHGAAAGSVQRPDGNLAAITPAGLVTIADLTMRGRAAASRLAREKTLAKEG